MVLVRLSCALVLLGFLGACASKPLFHWGRYEASVYKAYESTSGFDPHPHIQYLSDDLAQAEGRSKQGIAPGFLAHLGYLHYMTGDTAQAYSYFQQEKARFPESATLMDRFIEALKR